MSTESVPAHNDSHPQDPRRHFSSKLLWIGLAVVASGVAAGVWLFVRQDSGNLMQEGRTALARGDAEMALNLAERALVWRADSVEALVLAAEACIQLEQFEHALEFYERIPDDDQSSSVRAKCAAGNLLLLRMFRLSAAEQQFRGALKRAPDNPEAHRGLAYLLGLSTRTREASAHRLHLIRSGQSDATQLYLLAAGDSAIENPEVVRRYEQAAPDDPLPRLALARVAFELKDFDRAEKLLRGIIKSHPDLTEAQVRLGETLLQSQSEAEFLEWNAGLNQESLRHPRVWFVRGQWSAEHGDPNAAIRCYWEATRMDPNFQQALYQLGQSLVSVGRLDEADAFLKRASLLAQYVKAAELARNVGDTGDFQNVVELAQSLGLEWETYGWALAAGLRHGMRVPWARKTAEQLGPQLTHSSLSRTGSEVNPAARLSGASFPLPAWTAAPSTSDSATNPAVGQSRVTFWDRAAESGLDFQYFNGGNPQTRGIVNMYEVVGGGVAVLDLDLDSWPDVYFPQGCRWPPQPDQTEFSRRLYRNQGNGRFVDVSGPSGMDPNGFGQGATVGDFDSDGFPDICGASIGPNHLLRNNGDGTFSDVTGAAGIAGDQYTTSCLLADLNGDALPDVYAVNYLAGDDLFTRVCGSDDRPRSCLPQAFDAAQDRLYVNLGDGRFEDASIPSGIAVAPPGKGLGIVAADLEGSGRLCLYVANDVGPNFLFINRTLVSGTVPRFEESGLAAGAALNGNGNFESGMGVAAGDVDNDGRLDLFVTNFDNETNTLYRQTAGGLFVDQTSRWGLGRKSDAWVGWGVQFIDGELDGLPDLILTNGHVNDLRDHDKPYRMPPQYFSNVGGGRFAERPAQQLGPPFQAGVLGRGMARLDWNRDGLEDVLISHLDAPVALLTNTTANHGRFFACRLAGVRSNRDAIGTTVSVYCGDRAWTKQLTAGDGNQCSNERILVFGLGAAESIDQVEVRWPSGTVDQFSDLTCDTEFVFVEGRAELTPLSAR